MGYLWSRQCTNVTATWRTERGKDVEGAKLGLKEDTEGRGSIRTRWDLPLVTFVCISREGNYSCAFVNKSGVDRHCNSLMQRKTKYCHIIYIYVCIYIYIYMYIYIYIQAVYVM